MSNPLWTSLFLYISVISPLQLHFQSFSALLAVKTSSQMASHRILRYFQIAFFYSFPVSREFYSSQNLLLYPCHAISHSSYLFSILYNFWWLTSLEKAMGFCHSLPILLHPTYNLHSPEKKIQQVERVHPSMANSSPGRKQAAPESPYLLTGKNSMEINFGQVEWTGWKETQAIVPLWKQTLFYSTGPSISSYILPLRYGGDRAHCRRLWFDGFYERKGK